MTTETCIFLFLLDREKACTSSDKSVINSTVNLPHQEEVKLCYKNSDLDLLHNISVLQVHSVLKQSTYLQTCSNDKEIFVCVGTDIESNTQHRSQRFQKLLCHLLNEHFFLVSSFHIHNIWSWVSDWMSDCCLIFRSFPALSWWEQVNF